MRCEDARNYFADCLNQPTELPAPVQEHVSGCSDCQCELAEFGALWEDLARVLVPSPDSATMRARFQIALDAESQPAQPAPAVAVLVRRRWLPSQWTLRIAAVAASVSIFAFLAVSTWRVTGPAQTINGVAQDGSGGAIPGVKIAAVNLATGARLTTVTDAEGAYAFPDVPSGTYSVTAELEGFQTERYAAVRLNQDAVRLPFPMQAGASSAPIDLSGETIQPILQAAVIEPKNEALLKQPPVTAVDPKTTLAEAEAPSANPTAPAGSLLAKRAQIQLAREPQQNSQQASQSAASQSAGAPDAVGRLQWQDNGRAYQNAQVLKDLHGLELDQTRNQYEKESYSFGIAANEFSRSLDGQRVYTLGQNAPADGKGFRYFDSWRSDVTSASKGEVPNFAAVQLVPLAAATLVTGGSSLSIADNKSNTQSGGEAYDRIVDNPFVAVSQEPLATFSTDVDTASYANVRRFLNQNQLPPRNAVRIEELINYFQYTYPQNATDHPITVSADVAAAPWNTEHRLLRIGIKAKDVRRDRQPTNLVFLVDVSGSMNSQEKLPLLKNGLRMLASQLTENDTVTIVTYAGTTEVVLPATNGENKGVITQAIERLNAEGSTNGGSGIQLAYAAAVSNFIKGGVNRVILATDGDFNVGITSTDELVRLIEEKAKSGVFLSVLGFGAGNLNDSMMEKLADHGNGQYAYIDSINEARKVLVDDLTGTLVTVAKDVKIQVEFNPAKVSAYRLIGYENRALATADFNNDAKDAGDMGAGHTVTALFEVVPAGVVVKGLDGEPLRFQPAPPSTAERTANANGELIHLKVRYKEPAAGASKLIELPLTDRGQTFAQASADFRFAAGVAAFGMILRDSQYKGMSNWEMVRSIATDSRGQDRTGAREEFVRLVERAAQLWRR